MDPKECQIMHSYRQGYAKIEVAEYTHSLKRSRLRMGCRPISTQERADGRKYRLHSPFHLP